jgi:Protein of unknown function (DUF3237)
MNSIDRCAVASIAVLATVGLLMGATVGQGASRDILEAQATAARLAVPDPRELRSEFLMRLRVELEAPLMLPDTPRGTRLILYAKGGSFSGPWLQGEVLSGGGDWVLERRDGVAELDIRFTLRSSDGQLIYVRCDGLLDMTPEIRQRIRSGEDVNPSEYYFRTSPVFETGSEKYRRLNRLVAVGVGRRTATGMVTDIFEIK